MGGTQGGSCGCQNLNSLFFDIIILTKVIGLVVGVTGTYCGLNLIILFWPMGYAGGVLWVAKYKNFSIQNFGNRSY